MKLQPNGYKTWHQQYGPVICLKLAGYTVLILGTHDVVKDLLVKKARIYSARPSIGSAHYFTKGMVAGWLSYGPEWQKIHGIESVFFKRGLVQSYRLLQDLESKQLVYELLSGRDFVPLFQRFAKSTPFTILFGKRLATTDSPEVQELEDLVQSLVGEIKWVHLLGAIPLADRLPKPLKVWEKMGDRLHDRIFRIFEKYTTAAVKRAGWNWATELEHRMREQGLSFRQTCFLVYELQVAAFASTWIVLNRVIKAALLNPEKTRKVRQELDLVVGVDRLPRFEDVDRLPYTNAFLSEALRWRSFLPLGIPHSLAEDDEYKGCYIPKDTVVFPNQWALDHDEKVFHHPDEFLPERWIENPELPLTTFGFGKRICPGQHMARNTLFIAVVRCLWGYDLITTESPDDPYNSSRKAIDFSAPKGLSFVVRSEKHKETIEREWNMADKDMTPILSKIQEQAQCN
ncbi:putative cytochrome P450 [Aspergillus steynii IBT 23096]|uniref:Putative cytochrome P450 n=1 Tax=Aspergillus steynii IBT 23096 TaxID=1392250 RepID=A0A2I2G7G3_9EURO|nr:putative cytochrome P450 [Aspergillus steynii IBT 23096]PLB48815.1 putative cytochrome P450 [Aspergillus steynii IBT 23096]